MHRIKIISLKFLLFGALVSCIKPFVPVLEPGEENKYVVSGYVSDSAGYQTIYVSRSSAVDHPAYKPLGGCQVAIQDNFGNEFYGEESEAGIYRVWMDKEYLVSGNAYKVVVNTPTGDIISSNFDTLVAGPPIENIYYLLESHPTTTASVVDRGIQFYLDLNGTGYKSKHYRFEVDETWEYHAAHAKEFYYDGTFHQIFPPDSSTRVCYSNNDVKEIFTLTTQNLTENVYLQYPLHFVNGKSARLGVLYSVQLKQYTLTDAAFLYWDALRENSFDLGGLYEKQPQDIKGNLRIISGEAQEVLGFFYATSLSTRRIFVQNVPGLELDFSDYCVEESLGHFGWREFEPKNYPVYYYFNAMGALRILGRECVECERLGGSLEKPSFWPQ